jgi:hypothetical protein
MLAVLALKTKKVLGEGNVRICKIIDNEGCMPYIAPEMGHETPSRR